MDDFLIRYHNCPVVVFFGEATLPPISIEAFKTCSKFTDASAALEHIGTKVKQVNEDVLKIFNTFDKDYSGFIDKNELKQVCAEMGL
jgi:Ca2+-binding EF-hand superfamily protein